MCHKKIVLKTKSILIRTTNNVFRKVDNCTNLKWWFTQFDQKCNILEIFHYFQYFERFRSMKKWQISKPKIVDWYLHFSKESYTTLKTVISSFKICFQNYGKLKRKFLRPRNTSSTSLKFELSRLTVMSNTVALLRTVKSSWRIVRSVQTVSVANGPYSEHIRSVHLIMTSEHSVLQFVRSVRSVRIVTVRMLRAVDGSYTLRTNRQSC